MESNRRDFLKGAALFGAGVTTFALMEDDLLASTPQNQMPSAAYAASGPESVTLRWLGKNLPSLPTGVSWGVPWAKGKVRRETIFHLSAASQSFPLQMWPLAYWPDGSVKWSGFATVLPAQFGGEVTLSQGSSGIPGSSGTITVKNDRNFILVDTGALQCSIPHAVSANLIDAMTIEGRKVASAGRLVCIVQTGPDGGRRRSSAPRKIRRLHTQSHG